MKRTLIVFVLICCACFLVGAKKKSFEDKKAEFKVFIDSVQEARKNNDFQATLELLPESDNYPIIAYGSLFDANRTMFKATLENKKAESEFLKYHDSIELKPIKYNLSPDGKMGWVAYNSKSVWEVFDKEKYEDFLASKPETERKKLKEIYERGGNTRAGLVVFKRVKNKWVLDVAAMSDKEDTSTR